MCCVFLQNGQSAIAEATIEGLAFPCRASRGLGSAERRGRLSEASGSRREARQGNGVKNLNGSEAIPDWLPLAVY